MDDSDDYFDDDIVVDENVIAILEEEETKFSETQRLTQRRTSHSPPPAKRQKLNHPQNGRFSRTVSVDFEDLPEVSVVGDGTYGLFGANYLSRLRDASENAAASHSFQTKAAPVASSSTNSTMTGIPHKQQQSHSIGRPPPLGASSRGPSNTAQPHLQRPIQNERIQHTSVPSNHNIQGEDLNYNQGEVEALRAQLEQLRRMQEEMTQSLKEAQEARFAKEGEVTILRKSMEKEAQRHAAEIAKVKAAKEAAEAMQRQYAKDMKEGMERLKTQFTFKQLELETSHRKPPWTARAKRLDKQLPSSPICPPSQVRGWNAANNASGPSAPRTPSRTRIIHHINKSPQQTPNRKRIEDAPKAAVLPGFYNSFMTSPSVIRSNTVKEKGKDREIAEPNGEWNPFAEHPGRQPSSPLSSPARGGHHATDFSDLIVQNPVVDILDRTTVQDADMPDADSIGSPVDEIEQMEPPNWKEQIHRIVMTHTLLHCDTSTFQTLMSSQLPPSASLELAQAYSTSCAKLLQSLAAAAPKYDNVDDLAQGVSDALTRIALVLASAALIPALTALLNLIRILIYKIPFFTTWLLSVPLPAESEPADAPPRILDVIVQTIRKHAGPHEGGQSEEQLSLTVETLMLVEALSFHASQDLAVRLSYIPRSFQVLTILLDPAQPTAVLYRAARAISFLATHQSLFQHLLAFPNSHRGDAGPLTQDFSKIPHIERMASYLIDRSRIGLEANLLRETILKMVATLAVKHADAVTVLLASQMLIPSIVLFLIDLITPLFEDDEELQRSPSVVTWIIETGSRTLYTLYSLVFSGDGPPFNLRQKLLHEPGRAYYAAHNMFIVTLGRLSFADTPDWIGEQDRALLEECTELAKELLDLLVDGPEIEQVWSAFQPLEEMETEDDELEARVQHPE
ncbi:hypothetical protein OBBRIDRAFT_96429 [Obba rivulosa]|uniref:Uncharacterized protein n=1 Tax=Obba rivulosa TaxID=1052685 RepID=A0A8E2DII8_9APHY|nr:hypothetical protein OBBRIDRAFT_96429 [Obba rivulosa]